MVNPTLTNLFTDIADAIREKIGASDSIPAVEFPDRIREISGGSGGGASGMGYKGFAVEQYYAGTYTIVQEGK